MKALHMLAALLFIPALALAAEQYEVTEKVDVNAPAAKVWDVVKDFGNLNGWHPAVAKTEILSGDPKTVGAVRMLSVGETGKVKETLTAYSDQDMSFGYVINETNALPVKDYAATLKVTANGDKAATVQWTGKFTANPPEGKPDTMARDTMSTVYRAGLDNLKKMLEK
ncbi:MAG: SRPBCC family protein [Gammaproteobacteria bacterium]